MDFLGSTFYQGFGNVNLSLGHRDLSFSRDFENNSVGWSCKRCHMVVEAWSEEWVIRNGYSVYHEDRMTRSWHMTSHRCGACLKGPFCKKCLLTNMEGHHKSEILCKGCAKTCDDCRLISRNTPNKWLRNHSCSTKWCTSWICWNCKDRMGVCDKFKETNVWPIYYCMKCQRRKFSVLSPNNIIFDILIHVIYTKKRTIDKWGWYPSPLTVIKGDLGCFGYFRLDLGRHIWFVFRSVEFVLNLKYAKLILNRQKLEYIHISKQLSSELTPTKELKVSDEQKFYALFKTLKFPKLKTLIFQRCHFDSELQFIKSTNLIKLQKLQFDYCHNFNKGNFLGILNHKWNMLEKIYFDYKTETIQFKLGETLIKKKDGILQVKKGKRGDSYLYLLF